MLGLVLLNQERKGFEVCLLVVGAGIEDGKAVGDLLGVLKVHVVLDRAEVLKVASEMADQYGVALVAPEEIFDVECDIFCPCALGKVVNDETLDRLKCKIICGCANNQLEDEDKHGAALMNRGIVYAPDFLINAGGLINVGIDYLGGWSRARVNRKVEQIYDTTLDILETCERDGIQTQEAALKIAIKRIQDKSKLKTAI